jgi:hypothetical protein
MITLMLQLLKVVLESQVVHLEHGFEDHREHLGAEEAL